MWLLKSAPVAGFSFAVLSILHITDGTGPHFLSLAPLFSIVHLSNCMLFHVNAPWNVLLQAEVHSETTRIRFCFCSMASRLYWSSPLIRQRLLAFLFIFVFYVPFWTVCLVAQWGRSNHLTSETFLTHSALWQGRGRWCKISVLTFLCTPIRSELLLIWVGVFIARSLVLLPADSLTILNKTKHLSVRAQNACQQLWGTAA